MNNDDKYLKVSPYIYQLYFYVYYTIILFEFFFRLHGKDNVAIKRYVISFWNGIDLRYKLLKDPGVKISIAGIIISRVRKCFFK